MKKRVAVTIEYNGKNYLGWQKNGDNNTIEYQIEKALSQICGVKMQIYASGRTDAGVHALCQTAHFDLPDCYTLGVKRLLKDLNELLPQDIRIKTVKEVSDNFHARYNVKSKTYLYKFYTGVTSSPLREGLYAYVHAVLDLEKMKKVAALFVGKHDYSAFCSSGGDNETFVREIISIDIMRKKEEYYIYIKGKGFLYNMVRYIVGTIIKAGKGLLSETQIINALLNGDKTDRGEKMPACGLYLYSVEY